MFLMHQTVEDIVYKLHNTLAIYAAYTVTRPYAGFRHPDRMAPDSSVWGGENDCFIWSGNMLAQVLKFSGIFPKSGIFRGFGGHLSGESLAFAGTLHSSMPEDISGIFRRFPCEKMK
jgi:hypothetical protein